MACTMLSNCSGSEWGAAMIIGVDLASGESKTVWTLLVRDESHPDAFRILGNADDEDSLASLLPD